MNSGYQVFSPNSHEGQSILKKNKLTLLELDEAVAASPHNGGPNIASKIGITADGFIGSGTADWSPHMPDAYDDIIVIPWVQVWEILKKVPEGSAAAFFENGLTKQ